MTKSEKIKAYKRAWYERNREMQLSKEKERREARTPEEIAADKKYFADRYKRDKQKLLRQQKERMALPENKARKIQYDADRYAENKDAVLQQAKEWYQNNKARKQDYDRNRSKQADVKTSRTKSRRLWAQRNKEKVRQSRVNWFSKNPGMAAYYCAKRRKGINQRTPSWVDCDRLMEVYKNCPHGMHVDHIIPLHGRTVSGLHIPENLQYLSPSENSRKSNHLQLDIKQP